LTIPVIFTGAKNESFLIDKIFQHATQPHIRLDGKLDLKQLAALLKKSELIVANSTGPLHLAVAVGTEVVGLYCPDRACHPNRWGPYRQIKSVIMPPLEKCERCNKTKCEHFNCMELISVEQVFTKVKNKMSKSKVR
jgi:ADP-heptose:LPS heptosyltransferase